MKRCPTCNRTYADDGFTFCLSDGALLSAPYDPAKEKPVSTLDSSGPPPTAVLPAASDPKLRTEATLPPTIASPVKTIESVATPTLPDLGSASVPRRRFKPLYLVLALGIPLLLGGGYLLSGRALGCPNLSVTCIPSGDKAYCYVDVPPQAENYRNGQRGMAVASLNPIFALQAAALPASVEQVIWSTSARSITGVSSQSTVDTKGLAGQTITVKAAVTSKKWGCSQTVSTSFVVPAEPARPALP